MKRYDCIVVGQGLAGSVLALRLIEQGFSVLVIDKPDLSLCSKVSGGIWNPVVFKRLTKSWMIDELLPELFSFYGNCEKLFQTSLITERSIVKSFTEDQESTLWLKKASGELHDYLESEIYSDKPYTGLTQSNIGYSKVSKAGNLNCGLFLQETKKFLINKESYLEDEFDYTKLEINTGVSYKGHHASKLIFAEGHLVKHNPYFNYIPFKPAKGEVLIIKTKDLDTKGDIITKSAFLLPLENNVFKAGGTYNWDDLTDVPSEGALNELQTKLKSFIKSDFEVVEQQAGVRPSVIDRRPVIGTHPKHGSLLIFNGLGTKGVMLAPYFAAQLAGFLKFGNSLHKEVNVERFNTYFATDLNPRL